MLIIEDEITGLVSTSNEVIVAMRMAAEIGVATPGFWYHLGMLMTRLTNSVNRLQDARGSLDDEGVAVVTKILLEPSAKKTTT